MRISFWIFMVSILASCSVRNPDFSGNYRGRYGYGGVIELGLLNDQTFSCRARIGMFVLETTGVWRYEEQSAWLNSRCHDLDPTIIVAESQDNSTDSLYFRVFDLDGTPISFAKIKIDELQALMTDENGALVLSRIEFSKIRAVSLRSDVGVYDVVDRSSNCFEIRLKLPDDSPCFKNVKVWKRHGKLFFRNDEIFTGHTFKLKKVKSGH